MIAVMMVLSFVFIGCMFMLIFVCFMGGGGGGGDEWLFSSVFFSPFYVSLIYEAILTYNINNNSQGKMHINFVAKFICAHYNKCLKRNII